ncbi:vitelline envelope sperm lysin receptor-like [Gigantopelta aegis]|uniref:vitelline envelope sperm lysin receptor-like n=1 Tax=Gigantopelta aegis TaxID=1735272 RepID=UPI001B889811|nr:vitelline envelope sperm lysin receptor-like [Gigantopelta aegis]
MDWIRWAFVCTCYLSIVTIALGRLTKDRYIISVDITCGQLYNDVTLLTAQTDMTDALPYAVCKGRHRFNYTALNRATYTLNVTTEGDPTKQCVFLKHDGTWTYHVVTYVPISGRFFVEEDAPYVTTCDYAAHGKVNSADTNYVESRRPVEELLYNMGPLSHSSVEFYLIDSMDKRIVGDITLGQTIRIIANLISNSTLEVSLQTVSCKARGVRSTYPIILGGCGDGIIIAKDSGFTTSARQTTSPYFRSFRLPGSKSVSFECVFVVCSTDCDGSSCVHADRRKRSAANTELVYTAELTLRYHDNPPDSRNKPAPYQHDPSVVLPVSRLSPVKFEIPESASSASNSATKTHIDQSETITFNLTAVQSKSKLGQVNQMQFDTNVVNKATRSPKRLTFASSNELDKLYSVRMGEANRSTYSWPTEQLDSSNKIDTVPTSPRKTYGTLKLGRRAKRKKLSQNVKDKGIEAMIRSRLLPRKRAPNKEIL